MKFDSRLWINLMFTGIIIMFVSLMLKEANILSLDILLILGLIIVLVGTLGLALDTNKSLSRFTTKEEEVNG